MVCEKCGMQIEEGITTCPNCNNSIENQSNDKSNKKSSKLPVVLLCIFGGAFGLHRFYLGYKKTAAIMMGFTLLSLICSILVSIIAAFPNDIAFNILGNLFYFMIAAFICSMISGIWAFIDFIRIVFIGNLQPTKTSIAFKRLNKQQ